jgi:hypothetical protein
MPEHTGSGVFKAAEASLWRRVSASARGTRDAAARSGAYTLRHKAADPLVAEVSTSACGRRDAAARSGAYKAPPQSCRSPFVAEASSLRTGRAESGGAELHSTHL